ncbi:glycoside hydrolase family 16 protein [Xylona heveae TC161]|uniref:endo-1,3(4)-beta-glucanase n=1 Tax=Xylona heveae (strain CBS 132557 / TC161) TaxID=1328760 RepID=A0A165JCE5_XYLHT|nr:glycoside hydrolase family 16 protein [Xylona heveae TC161]KZF26050.1 glycoside hydrolase family 16 protein [Xylona heveae TC161]
MLWQTVLLALGLARFTLAEFVLADNYPIASFFDKFDFFNESDPTHGTVEYVEAQTAVSEGLVRTAGNSVYMGVDYSNVIPSGGGRPSVRLVSKNVYNHGLFILDLAHMPGGICGTWPAFWMVGPNWPYNGEIDIIEGANTQNQNDMTLHTGPNCSITDNGEFTGTMPSWLTDCNAAYGDYNGCQIQATATNSYGAGFNQAGGGVYATLWDSDAISIWFWSHSGTVPADIVSGEPDPTSWGEPLAMFQGGCNIDNSFKDMQIVFDTTFCGDWAGNTWSGTCSNLAPTCTDYVLNNPSAFTDAYWIINSLKVYEDYACT